MSYGLGRAESVTRISEFEPRPNPSVSTIHTYPYYLTLTLTFALDLPQFLPDRCEPFRARGGPLHAARLGVGTTRFQSVMVQPHVPALVHGQFTAM